MYGNTVRMNDSKHRQCFGGHSERETPGHIPNPEAKTLSADGTAGVTLWESRTPPDSFRGEATPIRRQRQGGVAGSLESPTRLPEGGTRRDTPGRHSPLRLGRRDVIW